MKLCGVRWGEHECVDGEGHRGEHECAPGCWAFLPRNDAASPDSIAAEVAVLLSSQKRGEDLAERWEIAQGFLNDVP